MAEFKLHQQLEQDTILIKELKLSKLLLMNDSNYPWFILVPKISNITEIHQLSSENQQLLTEEITTISKHLESSYNADKINVAALGNMVSQLHVHIIARFKSDACWPKPVWGQITAQQYDEAKITEIKKLMSNI